MFPTSKSSSQVHRSSAARDVTQTGAGAVSKKYIDGRSQLNLRSKNFNTVGAGVIARVIALESTSNGTCKKYIDGRSQLNLRSKNIGAVEANLIAFELASNGTLIQLGLDQTRVGDNGALAIARSLHTNKTLTTLSMEQVRVGDIGATAVANALRSNKRLTTLSLKGNGIGFEGAAAIADALTRNASLKLLELGGNRVGDEGTVAFAESLLANKTLESLSLAGNRIGNAGIMALARGLKQNASLTTLYLGENDFRLAGLTLLAQSVATSGTLTVLHLDSNAIESEGAVILAESLKRNVSLSVLSLRGNRIGYDGSTSLLNALKQHNRSLITLDLSQNPNTSPTIQSVINELLRGNKAGTRPSSIRAAKDRMRVSSTQSIQVVKSPVQPTAPLEVTQQPKKAPTITTETRSAAIPLVEATLLPAAWEARTDAQGRIYYLNHANKTTQWTIPPNETAMPPKQENLGANEPKAETKQPPELLAQPKTQEVMETLPKQRAEMEFEICRLTPIRDACLDTLDEEQWCASEIAEKRIRQIQKAILSGAVPTGDELEDMVKELSISIRNKVRNESVEAARPLREELLKLKDHLTREREAEARVRETTNNAKQTPTPSLRPQPPFCGTAPFPVAARSPFPPYSSSDDLTAVDVKYSYWGAKKFLGPGARQNGGNLHRGKTISLVIVNGFRLNDSQIQWFLAEFDVNLKPGKYYWYDKSSGFFGKVGKKPSCIVDPGIPLLGDLHRLSSVGHDGPESGVVINGRAIDCIELDEFHKCGMEGMAKGCEYIVNPDGAVHVISEPEVSAPMFLFNWREKSGISDLGAPEMQSVPAQGYSTLRNNDDHESTSTSGNPRPPPPPYKAPKLAQPMEPPQAVSSNAPPPPPPPPPPYHPPQAERPSINSVPGPRLPHFQEADTTVQTQPTCPRPPVLTAGQPHRPTRIDGLVEGLGGDEGVEGWLTLNVQLELDAGSEEPVTDEQIQTEINEEGGEGQANICLEGPAGEYSHLNGHDQHHQEGQYLGEENFEEIMDCPPGENEVALEEATYEDFEYADNGGCDEADHDY
jgi:tRNA U38,U39,U40 pseudouridine synthase TruA